MAKKKTKRPAKAEREPKEEIPAGATRKAFDRPVNPGGGAPGSGAGPRHAAGDPGDPNETYGDVDTNQPLAEAPPVEPEPLEEGPPYAGPAGGAVGGTPAQGRSTGGRTRRGIKPGGVHRGDSTIGADPESDAE